jgi:hypothetical protein
MTMRPGFIGCRGAEVGVLTGSKAGLPGSAPPATAERGGGEMVRNRLKLHGILCDSRGFSHVSA